MLAACNTAYGTPTWTANYAEIVPCQDDGSGATDTDASYSTCADWDPAANISLVSGVYEIDKEFVDYIVADPMRLVNCDSATIEYDTVDREFVVTGASAGTFLEEAGFQTGDVFLRVNGASLDDLEDAADAYGTFYLERGETEYTFTVLRGGTHVDVDIEIVS